VTTAQQWRDQCLDDPQARPDDSNDYAADTMRGTLLTLVAGGAAWCVFAFWLDGLLIGVRPVG
jgi:hypothetical protein